MSVRPTDRKNRQQSTSINAPFAKRVTSKRVYIGNLAWEVGWQDLKDLCKHVGHVIRADIASDSETGRSKGYGVVEFATIKDAELAIETLKGKYLMGRPINVREDREEEKYSLTTNHKSYAHDNLWNRYGTKCKVYVSNIPFEADWKELKDHLKKGGNVMYVDIFEDSHGKSKGCAIAEFYSPEDAARAILTLRDLEFKGRKLNLREDRGDTKTNPSSSVNHFLQPSVTQTDTGFNQYPPNYFGDMRAPSAYDAFGPSLCAHNDSLFSNQLVSSATSNIMAAIGNSNALVGQALGHEFVQALGGSIGHAIGQALGLSQHNLSYASLGSSYAPRDQPRPVPISRHPNIFAGSIKRLGRKIFVGHLSYDVTREELENLFRIHVNVVNVDLLTLRDGKSKGCAIIEVQSPSDVALAIDKLNNTVMKGRKIVVREDRDEYLK